MAAYRYHDGMKYCCICDAWFTPDHNYCPIHGRRLRTKPYRKRRCEKRVCEA